MAKVTVRQHPNPAVVYRILRSPEGGVAQDLYVRAQRVQGAARHFCGKDTGYLAGRIEIRPFRGRDGAWAFKVGVWGVNYARYHHDGNYHRQGAYIRPVRAKALRFMAGGRVVFAKRVRSYRGSRFLTKALPAARR